LSAIDPDDRSPDQELELCRMWYRVGAITDDVHVLDSAIEWLSHCVGEPDDADRDEWHSKSGQLIERRESLAP
jgi:hypothetical protein